MSTEVVFSYGGTMEADLLAHSGRRCEVLRPLTTQEADIYEVGPMYEVRFDDGFACHAFADELVVDDSGPGEEDGPWAEGYEERYVK